MKRILHLTLKKKWFDLIASGEKKEEYRDIKDYWINRFFDKNESIIEFDEIHFKNGYSKNSPFMRVEWKGLEWNNEKGIFIIILGKVLEVKG